jgi:hypothetical protein
MVSKQQKIAERAFHKFIMRGGEHGHDLADWIEAEKEITAEENLKKKLGTTPKKTTPRIAKRKKTTKK